MITKQDILNEIKSKDEKTTNDPYPLWLKQYKLKEKLLKLNDNNN